MEDRKSTTKENLKKFLDSDTGYATVTKVILASIAFAGIIFVMAAAPNVFQIFGGYRRGKRYSKNQYKNALYSLKRRGLVRIIKEGNNKIRIELTNDGKKRIKEFSIDSISISKQKNWDKKWRIVMFDIPSRFRKNIYNKAREALRRKLKELGFFQLQKSVWVFPYPCEDEILFISNIFEIEQYVEIITAEKILHDNKLKHFFNL